MDLNHWLVGSNEWGERLHLEPPAAALRFGDAADCGRANPGKTMLKWRGSFWETTIGSTERRSYDMSRRSRVCRINVVRVRVDRIRYRLLAVFKRRREAEFASGLKKLVTPTNIDSVSGRPAQVNLRRWRR